jgi:hypothetical protein
MENPNIQRLSFEEIQEFKDLDLFNLTWEQTNGRQVLLAYDPRSKTFGFTYSAPGTDGGNQNITLFYGYSAVISSFLDNNSLAARPSINGFDNGDGIITMNTVGTVQGFSFYDVEINTELNVDRYVFRTSFLTEKGDKGDKGDTGLKGDSVKGDPGVSAPSDQKFITYPGDFAGSIYTVVNEDIGKSIIVLNGTTEVIIVIPSNLQPKMQVGFVRDGIGEVVLAMQQGMTFKNAINGYRIKARYDQVFVEQGINPLNYYVFGNTKV